MVAENWHEIEKRQNLKKTKIPYSCVWTTSYFNAYYSYLKALRKSVVKKTYRRTKALITFLDWLDTQDQEQTVTVPMPSEISALQLENWLAEENLRLPGEQNKATGPGD